MLKFDYWIENRTHIVVQRTPTGMQMYVDGVLVGDADLVSLLRP